MSSQHYISSFELNQIETKRASLTFEEAVAVWIMRGNGETQQIIAARFGTNQGRIAEILSESDHIGSRARAFALSSG